MTETQAEPTGWQAEPTGWEPEPESTRARETQAEPAGWEAEPESTHVREKLAARPRTATVALMRCPFCRESDDKVVDSRVADEGSAIRRRRECLTCGRRYTTYERVEDIGLVIRKRSGATEPFDRDKLGAGLERAATNRLDDATIDSIVAAIEEELRTVGGEVGSDRVGLAVLEHLKRLDHVAYLRFASVYKGFEDLADFEREVVELAKTTEPKRR